MNHVGLALHSPAVEEYDSLIKKNKIRVFQIMTHSTKTGEIIWKPEDIKELRKKYPGCRIYVHSTFKVVIGRPYSVVLFREHYNYVCKLKLDGYIVHIPRNIEINFCMDFIAKMLKNKYIYPNHKSTIYFEHLPSEYYSSNMNVFAEKLKERKLELPVGICIDTCHIFSSGLRITTAQEVLDYMINLEEVNIPILIHLNDSKGECGSFVDIHAPLGTQIWEHDHSGLRKFMQIPYDKILELADCTSSVELLSQLI
jgi:hypothetical protein